MAACIFRSYFRHWKDTPEHTLFSFLHILRSFGSLYHILFTKRAPGGALHLLSLTARAPVKALHHVSLRTRGSPSLHRLAYWATFGELYFYPVYHSDLDLNLKRYIFFSPPCCPKFASNYRAHLRCQSPPKFPDMFKHLKRRMPWVIFKTACGWMFHDSCSCRGFRPTLAIRFIKYTPHLHKQLSPLDSESYCILNNKWAWSMQTGLGDSVTLTKW